MEILTSNNSYFYDNNTGVIFTNYPILSSIMSIKNWTEMSETEICNKFDDEFDIDEVIFYLKWLKKYNKFCKDSSSISSMELSKESLQTYLTHSGFNQLIFSVTSDCNSRCSYCIYSDNFQDFRNHSNKYMDFNIAKRAIDIYLQHFIEKRKYNLFKKPAFSFYGGEPLLNFKLIKKIVSYIYSVYGDDVIFSITTNGSILTEEICDYLIDNNFSILISLDGDEKEHDRKRVDQYNQKTFNTVFNNVNYLIKKNYNNFSINAVYDWNTDFINCEKFFKKNNLKIGNVSPVDDTFTSSYYDKFTSNDYDQYASFINDLKYDYSKFINEEDSYIYNLIEYPFISLILDSNLINVQRNFNEFTGTCVPGDKLFLNPNGDFFICERVPEAMPIGDVFKGIDFDNIKKIIENFNSAMSFCKECKFSFICTKCYRDFMYDNNFEESKQICKDEEKIMKSALGNALEFMELYQNVMDTKHTKYLNFYNWRN